MTDVVLSVPPHPDAIYYLKAQGFIALSCAFLLGCLLLILFLFPTRKWAARDIPAVAVAVGSGQWQAAEDTRGLVLLRPRGDMPHRCVGAGRQRTP